MEDIQKDSFQEKIIGFLKQNILVSALFCGGMILLGVGLIQYLARSSNNNSGAEFVGANSVEFVSGQGVEETSTSAQQKVFVDISGEVENPGVYQLDGNARVQDALTAAGGLGVDADRKYISKSVNLASPLKDGMKIYVPKTGETPVASVFSLSTTTTEQSGPGIVSINSASQSELEALPGIGPVTAGKIINLRPYSSTEELLTKKAVGKSVYEKIKDAIGL